MGEDHENSNEGVNEEQKNELNNILSQIRNTSIGDKPMPLKAKHAFWETQPMVQFDEEDPNLPSGPIDKLMTPADVRQDPYPLPNDFEWCECDMREATEVDEVYKLLNLNYVEDDDNMFRFDYSREFLAWALQPPGFKKMWHIGVRVSSSKKLVAFITAIPATIRIDDKEMPMVEINFLCIHKKLRSKRLAPVLIKEITRRVNLNDIWQASYTAGVVLPKPISTCRYWHRSLNPKKLIEVGFSPLHKRMTMARTIKLYKLPTEPATPGFRQMTDADVPQVTALLQAKLKAHRLAPVLDEAEVKHWLVPRKNVIDSFVVEDPTTKTITDYVSYYTLPSTIIGNDQYKQLKAAYCYYYVANTVNIKVLMNDALIMAKLDDYDVFNALDIMENHEFLKELKFGIGDGHLQYYIYNWRIQGGEMQPPNVGLVLL
eukprot:CAMPEP_0118933616 /NCGR_PEP_ID=MMETSP1169-20130426/12087_1 /TAXON_ID=36882 /ORGANISM="Pyramimonas obovata, Strain CCMP722" /LENGTH=429 /DNA_ID=CAMNT_0006876399 /DNA_START=60 /DNA_END=1349 /DNA_ORIENTATION=-